MSDTFEPGQVLEVTEADKDWEIAFEGTAEALHTYGPGMGLVNPVTVIERDDELSNYYTWGRAEETYLVHDIEGTPWDVPARLLAAVK